MCFVLVRYWGKDLLCFGVVESLAKLEEPWELGVVDSVMGTYNNVLTIEFRFGHLHHLRILRSIVGLLQEAGLVLVRSCLHFWRVSRRICVDQRFS